jgi:hypothetical protein
MIISLLPKITVKKGCVSLRNIARTLPKMAIAGYVDGNINSSFPGGAVAGAGGEGGTEL